MIHADRFCYRVTDKTRVAGVVGALRPGEEAARIEDALDAFLERLAAETADKPTRAAHTPRLLSRRPIFVG